MPEDPLNWRSTLVDPKVFEEEQQKLAHTWTFLGIAQDVAQDGDWFRSSLATRSVFVQRFGDELRGFENLCAHRFYPLRNKDRGNGPILCGFHHWLYNRDGRAVGIPNCSQVFGVAPHQVDARLNQMEVETCGSLIFGRFPSSNSSQSLQDFLGEAFPILAAMTRINGKPYGIMQTIEANWKLGLSISYDDYHAPAVHPTTFGKEAGYLRRENVQYRKIGLHSMFLATPDTHAYSRLLQGCGDGTYRSNSYFIVHVLPNLVLSHVRLHSEFWFCNIQQYSPVTSSKTTMRSWSYQSPFPANHAWHVPATRLISDPILRMIYVYYYRRVTGEDRVVCERLQSVAHQITKAPLLGALESRIAWFEEAYRYLLA
jgi:phenylpropionate dioxygenase-like ring-hydroxylating dioxygenase large terminal subunit